MIFSNERPGKLINWRAFIPESYSDRWIYGITSVVLILNFMMLLYYQHYLAGDFPIQDEWGYVHRLQEIPNTGLIGYLFDRYQNYYMPVFFLVWYLFYALAHLDFMVIRYTGAVISALVSLLLCVMLYRIKSKSNLTVLLVILCGPFIVCSYTHWATYNQSIESVTEFLLFGIVLASCWAAEGTLRPPTADLWAVLCVIGGLLASGVYAPGLSLLPAVVAARFVIRPRIDWPLIVMAVPAVVVPVLYATAGVAATHAHGHGFVLPGLSLGNLLKFFEDWVGLAGNALFIPVLDSTRNVTRALGAMIIIVQAVGIIHVLRLPIERRARFLVPLILTVYSTLVFIEIIAARFHVPDVEFTPRYSIHMIGGPVSVLFWIVTLYESIHWHHWLKAGAVAFVMAGIGTGVVLAEAEGIMFMPYARNSFMKVRVNILALKNEPNATQLREMLIGKPLQAFVYPGKLYLEVHELAMYKDTNETEKAKEQLETQINEYQKLQVIKYGPKDIKANVGFNIQSDGVSALWIQLNDDLVGKVFVFIDGTRLPAVHRGSLVTVQIPASLYSKPGKYPMYVLVIHGDQETKSSLVDFVVH
jgi:hypothetical protein